MQIRQATRSDAATIVAFNAAMAEETEHLALDRKRLLAGVEAVLNDPSKGFYLVACAGDGRIAGQLMITYEWSDWRNGNFWWIQSVYVDPEFRGQGVFQRLYYETERMARVSGESCGLRLYVEGENRRAQQVYERLGMRQTSYRFFEVDFVLVR
jgi:ribosomal protein S18 acetylase RimI-like enzyme